MWWRRSVWSRRRCRCCGPRRRARSSVVSSDAAAEAYETWGGYGASKAALDQLAAVLGGGGAGAAGVGGRSGRHADGSLRGGGTGRRRSAAAAGECGARLPAAAGRAAGEWAVRGAVAGGVGAGRSGAAGSALSGGAVTALEALRVPEELSARVPAEQRGAADRDDVRLLVSRGHGGLAPRVRGSCRGSCGPGTCSWSTRRRRWPPRWTGGSGGARVVVHFSTRGDDGRWAVELRGPDGTGHDACRVRVGRPGPVVRVCRAASRLVLEEPLAAGAARGCGGRGCRTPDVPGLLRRHGRPIRYAYTERDQPLSAYQTVFALPSPDGAGGGDAERGAALHHAAGGGAGEPGRAVRADHAAHRGGVGGGARAAVPGAVRGAARRRPGWSMRRGRAAGGSSRSVRRPYGPLESAAGAGRGGAARPRAGRTWW